MDNYIESLKHNCQFQNMLVNMFEKLGGSELETISLVFEEDHFHLLLESLKEVKAGKIVSFQEAFSDLY
ncbi:MAG TPA: hypothetical protein P5556_01165 [Candidatus Gastranaerophilales bacterium]|nr:hypothetical protein [Candidatus Gastranaerophilales bacterium]